MNFHSVVCSSGVVVVLIYIYIIYIYIYMIYSLPNLYETIKLKDISKPYIRFEIPISHM